MSFDSGNDDESAPKSGHEQTIPILAGKGAIVVRVQSRRGRYRQALGRSGRGRRRQ